MTKKRRNKRPQPLAPPPQSSTLRSRKRARKVTSLFHKYTQERDAAIARARRGGCHVGDDDYFDAEDGVVNKSHRQIALLNEVKKWEDKISEIGGREEYQRASILNTSLFSTTKWVLGILGRWGWLDGLPISRDGEWGKCNTSDTCDNYQAKKGKKEKARRDVRILEIGAINTQLLDAAVRTRIRHAAITNEEVQTDKNSTSCKSKDSLQHTSQITERVYHLDVNAIDIQSTDPRIQQMDFFDLPLPDPNISNQLYDVIINSMVINCVTTPAQRGKMLRLCYKHLRPGGICFLTLPKLCLMQSKFMSRSYFEEILTRGVGFEILHEVGRESPKVAFFVLRRPEKKESIGGQEEYRKEGDEKFTRMPIIHRGKKFRNTFAVTLDKEEVAG